MSSSATFCFWSLIISVYTITITSSSYTFTVDLSSTPTEVYPFWQTCTTFDHAYSALRADFQQQLRETVADLKIEFVRFHSIFDDSIGILNPRSPTTGNGNSPYSYVNVDKIYDFLQSINIKPLVEMDFIPSKMSNSSYLTTMYEYPVYGGPPLNNTEWSEFVNAFIKHIVERYGVDTVSTWAFDAWNEPNESNNWASVNNSKLSRIPSFEETWKYTANAVKSVNNTFNLGAPGAAGLSWFPAFPQWAVTNNVALDTFSVHLYPPGSNSSHNAFYKELKKLEGEMRNISDKIRISNTAYGCYLESYGADQHNIGPHDTSENAACFGTLASQFQGLNRDSWFLWCFTGFSDLWDQQGYYSAPFHNGYGWITQRNIKKATYHTMRLLVEYASNRKYFDVKRVDSDDETTTLEVFVTVNNDENEFVVFIMNWISQEREIKDETVIVELNNNKNKGNVPNEGVIYRIDSDHCNPDVIWQKQGSPTYPTQNQIDEMVNASNTYPDKIGITNNNGDITLKVDIPVYGMAVVVIDLS